MPKLLRLFTAFELPSPVLEAWEQAQQALQARLTTARWTPLNQAHLTLHFLGDQPSMLMESLVTALTKTCAGVGTVELGLGSADAFPHRDSPRVIWLGVNDAGGKLATLEAANRAALAKLGVTLEARAYRPHLTLAREPADPVAAAQALAELAVPAIAWQAKALVLFSSQLAATGATHTPVARFELA